MNDEMTGEQTHRWIGLISLFPEMFTALEFGIPGRALASGLITLAHWNPRDFANNKHRRVDDRPYGGGPGMVMQYQPLLAAIQAAKQVQPQASVIYLSPQGKLLTQAAVRQLATYPALILVNGRYEGVDERLIHHAIDEEWSIGDYVISGGELASMVLIDAIVRCLPGALGDPASMEEDSFAHQRLDYPHYTRPEEIDGLAIPDVLKSGDHVAIQRWRLKQALGRTWLRRPDLFTTWPLNASEQALLTEFIEELRRN